MSGPAHLLAVFGHTVDSAEGIASWIPWQSEDGYSLGWKASWIEDPKRHWYFYTRVRVDLTTVSAYSGATGNHRLDFVIGTWSMDVGGDGD